MYIARFGLANFKSYKETAPVHFTPGLNVVVGQNNAGKSALLEALSLNPPWNPHKSPESLPFEGAPPNGQAKLDVSFCVSRDELLEIMMTLPETLFQLPYPLQESDFARSINFIDDSVGSWNRLSEWFLSQEGHTFNLTYHWTSVGGAIWRAASAPSYGHYPVPQGSSGWTGRRARYLLNGRKLAAHSFVQTEEEIGLQLVNGFRSRIYVFRAERLNVGECAIGNNPVLAPNASNLASALNLLQGNKIRFERFNRTVRTILPQVPWISVRPTTQNQQVLEILVRPFESHADRDDLAIPLRDSGTGLGQVLSMLYVVLTSTRPTVIVIDEPQSFLHPGAARKLIEVLANYPQHQYIITTHSPSVVSAGAGGAVTLARLQSGATVLEQVNTDDAKGQEILLAELGARLSDVFGSDNILWVEGQTEEVCYRTILRDLIGKSLMGTQILGVRHTGDLEGVAAERTLEIYGKMASGTSLVPPALGFLFDSECLSDQKKAELVRKSNGLLSFLPRRMYENYLLNPKAIAAVASSIENFRTKQISSDEVTVLLQNALNDRAYYCDKVLPEKSEKRISLVHAKKALRTLFSDLSETRVRYDEVGHGLALTEWLIANEPAELREVRELLTNLLVQYENSVST